MNELDWRNGYARTLTVFFNGTAIGAPDERGRRVTDDHFVMLLNGHHEDVEFTLPKDLPDGPWSVALHTAADGVLDDEATYATQDVVTLPSRSVVLLRAEPTEQE